MKILSRLFLSPALAAVLLGFACIPSDAAGGSVGRPTTGLGVWRSTRSVETAVPCVEIVGGRVISEDQSYQSNGAVGANGVIRVTVASGGLSASGSGRLSHNSGASRWASSRGECSGSWSASRRATYY
jgi:hypothetical protein